ncbi:MAG: hypothetical protein HZB39_16715, partial [Planctomycetes bacterium]|nr:hypothetical protein [Planctomycetota bacterium]
MSRILVLALLGIGLVLGALAWGNAIGGRDDRFLVGAVVVLGSGVIVFALAAARGRGGLPRGGSHARVLLYGLLLAAIAHVLVAGRFDPARACLFLHCGLAAGALWSLRCGRVAPGAPALPLIADVVIGGMLFFVGGAEATLRVMAAMWPRPTFLQRDMTPSARLACVQPQPDGIYDGRRVNRDGFVDAPFEAKEGEPAVLVLGDGALALGVPAPRSAIAVARSAAPGITVWNATLPQIGVAEAALVLERLGSSLRPAAVVLTLNLGDDVLELRQFEPPWLHLATWLDRDDALISVVARRILERVAERERLGDTMWRPLEEPIDDVAGLDAKLPWLVDPDRQPPRASDELLASRSRAAFDANRGALADGTLEALVARVIAMRDAARAIGAGFGVVILPARYQVDGALWSAIADGAPDDLRDRPRADLVQRLRAHDVA